MDYKSVNRCLFTSLPLMSAMAVVESAYTKWFLCGLILSVASAQELLKNHELDSTTGWDCWNIYCEATTDHHSGTHAVKATGRHQVYEGPSQTIHGVHPGHHYTLQGWAKLVNDNGRAQALELEVEITLKNGHKSYTSAARRSTVRTSTGWVHLSGVFIVASNVDFIRVYFQGPEPGIDFIADAASLTEFAVQGGGDWKTQANGRIDHLRKNNIHITVTTGNDVDNNSVTIETIQTTKSFPFGTAVNAHVLNNHNGGSDQKYKQFIYDHFNWAVIENSLKWNQFERSEGHPDYNRGLTAVKTLRSHGIKVRGHNLIWAIDNAVPNWLKSKSPSEVRNLVHQHIHDTVTRYKGLVEHWDVNNEMLHGKWYVIKLNDQNYTKEIFKLTHQYDSTVTLFLNDFSVVANGFATDDYLAQAKDYIASGTHVGGMGVQSHWGGTGTEVAPDPVMAKIRLDKLAQAGLPIWITELDVQSSNESTRAEYYDTALRLYYSHPAVEGILIWGFWGPHHWRGDNAALVSGQEFRINKAGQKFLHLMDTEWKTHNTYQLSRGSALTVRGFHGDYTVNVKVNGHTTHTEHFTLGKSDHALNIHI